MVYVAGEQSRPAADADRRVGERVRLLRLRRGLGLKACAQLCGRTDEWLRQVERGEQPLDKLSTVAILARVLGVSDLGVILGDKLAGLTCRTDAQGRPVHAAVGEIQRTLSSPAVRARVVTDVPAEAAKLRRRVDDAWAAWHTSRRQYTAVGVLLPHLLGDAIGLHRAAGPGDRRRTWAVLSEVFQLAQRFLYCVGEPALAARAADRAMVAAEEADDPWLLAMSAWTSTMAALLGGRHDEAVDLASRAARSLNPLPERDPAALSAWGSLHLFAASAHAQSRRPADAWRHWDKADEAARRLGPAHHNPLTMFGSANVGIYAVFIDVETGRATSALTRARCLEVASIASSNRRAQHLIDVGRGYVREGDQEAAIDALVESERHSCETIVYSPGARELVAQLARHGERRPDPRLLALAGRVGVLS